ncbi:MAG: hypothetical protein RR909_03900 [Bacilli bacterium]
MNQKNLKMLIQRGKNVDINDDLEREKIFNEKVDELCENEDETINFLSTCSKDEFNWISNAFEDIIMKFKSEKVLDSIKSNSLRFPDLDVSDEIEYACKAMQITKK